MLSLGIVLGASPGDAARRARRYPKPPSRPVSATARQTSVDAQPVRNVILFVADGYTEGDWRDARAALPGGLLSFDRMPVTGVALLPAGEASPDAVAAALSGCDATNTLGVPPGLTVFQAAKKAGKAVALVSGGAVTDPLPGRMAMPGTDPSAETLRRLAGDGVDVLFARSAPESPAVVLEGSPYALMTTAASVLVAEAIPAVATVPAPELSFDALSYRALHLAAKSRTGFAMGICAAPDTVRAVEFSSAVSGVLDFAARDKRTLVLVIARSADGPAVVYAAGRDATKFAGTLMATDIPKIVAGVMNIKPFRRDFSPLFRSRTTEAAAPRPSAPSRPGPLPPMLAPLPW